MWISIDQRNGGDKMLWSTLLKILNYRILLKIQIYKKLDIRTAGYESRVPKTALHVIFLEELRKLSLST